MYRAKTFNDYTPEHSRDFMLTDLTDFEGAFFKLYATNGDSVEYHLEKHQICWFEQLTKQHHKVSYRATSIRDGIYLIDYIFNEQSISIILDLYKQIFTKVIGQPPDQTTVSTPPHITTVDISIIQGSIDKPYKANQALHNQTDELIGSHYLYYCNYDTIYEHVYLNQHYYTWHCIMGKHAGFADTSPCYHFKIADKLYLLVWTKRTTPHLGIMLMDTKFYRTDGKVYNYEIDHDNELNNTPVNPHFSLINEPNLSYKTFLTNIKNNLS